ncbi:MAG: YoaK family protein [Bacillota bacterium]|nr:YoaK family protein [Bacillota bacterium]
MRERSDLAGSLRFAALLTLAGGLQDSYSYLLRGEVFANAQTGNIVLLAHNLASGNWEVASNYLLPLLSFILGVYVTVPILLRCNRTKRLSHLELILLIELILLFYVGFLPSKFDVLANSLMSFTCAMQVNTFKTFKGLPAATTMCIGNIRSGTDLLARYVSTGEKAYFKQSSYYFTIIFIFFSGAALGSLLKSFLGLKSIWVSALFLLVAFLLLFHERNTRGTKNS